MRYKNSNYTGGGGKCGKKFHDSSLFRSVWRFLEDGENLPSYSKTFSLSKWHPKVIKNWG